VNIKGFHWVKYARRKPAARYGANGTSTPILEPRGLRANTAIPTTAPIQNENMNPGSAAEPARSAHPKTNGASARPIARPLDAKWMSARLAAMRKAALTEEKNAEGDDVVIKPVTALAAMNTISNGDGSI